MNPVFSTACSCRGRVGDDRPRAERRGTSERRPFVDAKEYLGGILVLEADNLDAATALAARVPAARMGGAVEVRPIVER